MDLLNLRAKITLDSSEYDQGIKGLAGKAGQVLGKVAKIGGAAIAAGGAAVVALTKQSIDAYKEFEQLEGGIETLYGSSAEAVEKMLSQADNAWKTAGMSANEYMETAIQSSAALISSLGGDVDAAADLMDMSITDMSDNVNKMGTSMESIQNAYRGFSRGNFTMLDNLALGYAGTKEGMQQLLDKAKELSGVEYDIDSYADIVQAIHVVQTEMGITGTTAKEAAGTISGSVNAMKSAWTNLVTGLSDSNADLDKLIDDFIDSLIGDNGEGGVIGNIMPAVERALNGIVKVISTTAPKLVPILVNIINQNLPTIIKAGAQIIVSLISGIVTALPQLIEALPEIFTAIKEAFVEQWPAIKEAGHNLLVMFGEGILDALNWLIDTLLEYGTAAFDNIYQKTVEWLGKIKTYIINKWDEIKTKVSEIITNFKTKILELWDDIKQGVVDKVTDLKQGLVDKFWEIWGELSGIVDWIKGLFDFEWNLPDIHLPNIFGGGASGGATTSNNEPYAVGYNNPMMFTKPTVLSTPDGLKKFGDKAGAELVYGHGNLMNDIRNAVSGMAGQSFVFNIYPSEKMDERDLAAKIEKIFVANARQRRLKNA